ncbi:unnamed protein product, partial [Sphagnum tenellum]
MCTRLESMLSTFTSVVRNFRLSLPNHHDPDQIAAYCDHRPHVLIFRLLEWHSHFQPDLISLVLAELQDRLPPFPSDEAVAIIEEEFWVESEEHLCLLINGACGCCIIWSGIPWVHNRWTRGGCQSSDL